jgi:tRNA threonylcarbamoyladenosine biosynthesis protein TsaE
MLQLVARNETETESIARAIASNLNAGSVVALIGDLGTGKTRFVAGAVKSLGYEGRVRSPTYTLLNIYQGRLPIYHFDLYRLANGMSETDLDEWDEMIYGIGVCFIEWAERMSDSLPEFGLIINLSHIDENQRRLQISGPAGLLSKLDVVLAAFRDQQETNQ